jgi:hypothetical protein
LKVLEGGRGGDEFAGIDGKAGNRLAVFFELDKEGAVRGVDVLETAVSLFKALLTRTRVNKSFYLERKGEREQTNPLKLRVLLH